MNTQIVSASKLINAPAEILYNIIADYQSGHPTILPEAYFPSLDVEEGGYGEGTIIRYQMRVLGQTQTFRALITEPDPGCTLLETDLESNTSTSFTVWSLGNTNQARVTIMTILKTGGLVKRFLTKILLTNIYRKELQQLTRIAQSSDRIIPITPKNAHGHRVISK